MSKKSILIISFTHLKNDPRVFRQIQSLHEIGYCIYAMGLSDPEIQGVHFLEITKQEGLINKLIKAIYLILKFHEQYYWSLKVVKQSLKKTEGLKFDLIIANDLETLPLAAKLKAKSNAKLLFDAHEYSPREHEDRIIWNLLFKDFVHNALKKYTSFIDKMFTVCEGISLEYAKNYNLQPIVVTNATEYIDTKPIINHNQNIKLIHHGGSIRSRKIENMIYMMDYLDKRFTLDLMLVPSQKKYHKELVELVKNRPNILIIDPVPMKNIVPFISSYDMGVYILEPTNFNNGMALPNKIFEYIQARLAVAIGPSSEMKRLTENYNIGVVSHDFKPKSLANLLNNLRKEDIINFKNNSNSAAKILNSEANIKIIKDSVFNMIGI